jgi:hypothetical protein
MRARDLAALYGCIKGNPDGTYTVASQWNPGINYIVRLVGEDSDYCTCPDSRYRKIECKHFLAVREVAKYIQRGN